MTDATVPVTTRKDWSSDQEVRWCPGCGDYSILAAVQMLMPELGVRRENTVFVSGIGCAARFPYYMNTYGMHSIHGRAPAIATGLAMARPDLDVWVVGGDGDMLSIGGNHLIHALRRNVNLTILMFNNQIYGLTKGQYSPTSEVGKVTKSTPFGSLDTPFNPISVALGAEATLRGPHPRHGPQAHDGDVPPGARPHGRGVRRDLPELQRLQRRRVRDHHGQGGPRRHADPARPRRADPLRCRRREGCRGRQRRQARRSSTSPTSARTRILVHDETDDRRSASCCRGSRRVRTSPRPIGVFRAVERPEYAAETDRQLAAGPGAEGAGRPAGPAALGRHLDRRLTARPLEVRLQIGSDSSSTESGGAPRPCGAWGGRTSSSGACARRRGRCRRSARRSPGAAARRPRPRPCRPARRRGRRRAGTRARAAAATASAASSRD